MIKIIGRVESKTLKEVYDTNLIDDKVFGFFVDYSDMNIPLNTIFEALYFNKQIAKISAQLIYISNELFFEFEEIEEGYKTICVFRFSEASSIIEQIPVVDDWYNYDDPYSFAIMGNMNFEEQNPVL